MAELPKTAQFGSDMRLLSDLTKQNSRARGADLVVRQRLRSGRYDIVAVSDAENIEQALLLRFLTPVGELAILGHPDYGCRLVELIGELNNERTRNRAKMFVLQALAAEPRVKEVLTVTVDPNPTDRTRVDINANILTIDGGAPLNLVFPFFLDRSPGA